MTESKTHEKRAPESNISQADIRMCIYVATTVCMKISIQLTSVELAHAFP